MSKTLGIFIKHFNIPPITHLDRYSIEFLYELQQDDKS